MNMTSRIFTLLTLLCLLTVLPVLAQTPVPEAAQARFKAGVALIEKADTPADLRAALTEFEAAAELAPQWPEIHYNLAQLAAETDKPAKAIKEYHAYLDLTPDTSDRAKVEVEIGRMTDRIARKRKIGLPGVTFASMPDGIWILQIFPGSRVSKTGLSQGDKILEIEGKSVVGATLDDFFKMIEEGTDASGTVSVRSKGRLFARTSVKKADGVTETGPVLTLRVKSAAHEKAHPVLIKKSMFHSNVIEIEADEFETEVVTASLPVVVTFWADWCEPCREFIPLVEAESVTYAGKLKFVNLNVDENKDLAGQLGIKGVPTMLVYKGGVMVSNSTGQLDKLLVDEILRTTGAN